MVKLACPLQETLSLWTSVRCIMRLLWCATPCLCWVTASTGTYWLRAKNTAGWDRSDTTIQVRIQNVIRATERTARTSFYSPFIFSLKTKMKSTSCDKKKKKKTLPVYVLHTFKVLCTHRGLFCKPIFSPPSRHNGVPEQQKLCRRRSVPTSRPAALQPQR